MDGGPKFAQIASLVGDAARANMLAALINGSTLTASELAYVARVSRQTASGHLAKLDDAGLVLVQKQGRRRYFRLASPLVARMLEGIMVVAQDGPARQREWRGGEALRNARTCYDHMAGRIAVRITDCLLARSYIALDEDGGTVTEAGSAFLAHTGIDLSFGSSRRVFCRPCLDWSERRPHLAGAVGAALLNHALVHDWVRRARDSRALSITPAGQLGFLETYGIQPGA